MYRTMSALGQNNLQYVFLDFFFFKDSMPSGDEKNYAHSVRTVKNKTLPFPSSITVCIILRNLPNYFNKLILI